MLFIDGSHEYDDVVLDLVNYSPLVKSGGYLLIDDACNDMNEPFGFFQGIEPVTRAVLEWEKTEIGQEFEFVFNVVHNRLYRRK
jgi:cephalosporin hydroxylase